MGVLSSGVFRFEPLQSCVLFNDQIFEGRCGPLILELCPRLEHSTLLDALPFHELATTIHLTTEEAHHIRFYSCRKLLWEHRLYLPTLYLLNLKLFSEFVLMSARLELVGVYSFPLRSSLGEATVVLLLGPWQ